MTNNEKAELRSLVMRGFSFNEIRSRTNCSSQTIKNYIVALRSEKNNQTNPDELKSRSAD